MSLVSPAQAEEALSHLTHQFAQWRQSRTTPRGRIPKPLWAQAITLAHVLPCARVAKQLGLTPQALKRRRDALRTTPALTAVLASPTLWKSRRRGVRPRRKWRSSAPMGRACASLYSEATPALVPLLQTFLETR